MFSDVVMRVAKDKGIKTIAELEEKAGVGNGTIAKWNEFNNPQAQTLRKIAEFLEVPYESIFSEECFREES